MAFPSISGVIADASQADGTTLESLSNWIKYSASSTSIITASGQFKLSASTYAEYGYHVSAGPDCEGYFTVPAKANGNQVAGAWVAFRTGAVPGSNSADRFGYQVECDTSTSGNPRIEIYKKTAPSTSTSVAFTTSVAMVAGDKIGWRCTGSNPTLIEVFLFSSGSWNQTPILTYSDSTSPYTAAGSMIFGMVDSSAFPLRIDDIGYGTVVAGGGATVTAVPQAGVADLVAAAVSFDAGAVTGVPLDATADLVAAAAEAGSSITAPVIAGTGDLVAAAPMSVEIGAAPMAAAGDLVASALPGGDATVVGVPLDATAALVAPAVAAGADLAAVPQDATADLVAAGVAADGNATVAAVPLAGVADLPAGAVSPQTAAQGGGLALLGAG